ncbi:MAG: TatD family hydrolase [Candidatus Hodarchaeota archaeon]
MLQYIDIHCHLPDNYFYKSIDSHIKTWSQMGLRHVVSVSQNYSESIRTLELEKKYPMFIIPAIGIHPWKAHKKHEDLDLINELLSQRKIKILGEIGLDKHFITQKERYPFQRKVLDFFIELAEREEYRLMLHIKGAEEEIINKIETSTISGKYCCIHWFSGSTKMLRKFIDLDCYFSCGPALEYSIKHQQVPLMAPLERLLTESDGNVMYRGRVGHPGLIPEVVNLIANLTRHSRSKIQEIVIRNFFQFLGIEQYSYLDT